MCFMFTLSLSSFIDSESLRNLLLSCLGEHYQAVKTKCCIENAVPSQCITATVLGKPKGLMSVATKVVIQMNCKLGGEPWAVKIPLKKCMIIG